MCRSAAFAFSAILSAVTVVPAGDIQLTTPLKWMPTDDYDKVDGLDLSILNKHEIQVTGFVDTRAKKDEIGKNVEDEGRGEVKLVNTKTNVAEWCAKNFANALKRYRVDLAGRGDRHHGGIRCRGYHVYGYGGSDTGSTQLGKSIALGSVGKHEIATWLIRSSGGLGALVSTRTKAWGWNWKPLRAGIPPYVSHCRN